MVIKEIDFDTICLIWKEKLWPSRFSPIETHSAMMYQSNFYDAGNFLLPVWYIGCYDDNDELIGVNSGHMCVDGLARSRGLWVCPKKRQNGHGKQLLLATIEQARHNKARGIWSFPRKSSDRVYKSAGFTITSEWQQSETSEANAYCYMDLI